MMRASPWSVRQPLIKILEQEREDLLNEERRAPHEEDALTVWTMADTLSGHKSRRDERKSEIERDIFLAKCGYRLLTSLPSKEDPTGRILMLITLDPPKRVAGRITREYLRHMYPGAAQWPMILYQLADGHRHVACTRCSEPFLQRRNTDYALKLLMYDTHPTILLRDGKAERDPAFDAKIEAAIITEYRTVPGGPKSSPVLSCPGCGEVLDKGTVKEVQV